MSRRPSFQSELSYDSGSLADLSAASTSRLPNRPESGRTANSQQQQTWPNSISSVLAQPSSSSNFFLSPSSTLQNLNPLRPAAQAGSRNAASRGKPAATVQLSVLPEVQKSEFETYLSEIQDEYAVWAKQKRPTTASIVKSPSSNSITDLSSFHRHQLLPDLEVVPTLFMSEDFDLTLPRTFEAVTQLNPTITATVPDTSEAASRKPPSASPSFSHMALGDIASDQMLQEKLSHYLDVVEQHLALEIASRSSTFFSALSNLQALDSQSEAALKQAAQLKSQLALVARWSQAGLQGLRMALRRHRLQKIQEGAVKIKEVVKALGQASDLATEGEWEGALGLVEEVQTAYHSDNSGQKQQDLRLDRLKALSGVPSKLVTLKKTIATSLQAELLNVLTHQLHAHTHTYVKQSQQLGKDFKWEASNLKEVASEATRSLIRGLVRCGPGLRAVEDGVATWRESVLSTIQGIIQKVSFANLSRSTLN